MAISTSSYFSNSIIGVPQVGADIDIYETSTNPKYAVGFGFERADGNKYRYSHFGLLSPVGSVVAPDHTGSSMTSTQLTVGSATASIVKKSGETLNPNAAGARYMQLTPTISATADQFAGAYIGVIAGSGTGYTYRISGNTAQGTPAATMIYVDLYDPIAKPVGPNSGFLLTGSKYANLSPAIAITSGGALSCAAGFVTVGQTAGSFGWICSKGITTAVLGSPVGSIGNYAIVSTNTAGSIVNAYGAPSTSTVPPVAFQIVGIVVQTYSASSYCLVDAKLE